MNILNSVVKRLLCESECGAITPGSMLHYRLEP